MNPLAVFDDFCYLTNWITRIVGFARFGGASSVQFRIPRGKSYPSLMDIKAHLARHGVATFAGLHDSRAFYFSVKRSQEKFARYLYDEQTGQMRSTRSTWTERRTGKARKMSFWEGWF